MAINMRVLANGVEVLTDLTNHVAEIYHVRNSTLLEDREEDEALLERMTDILTEQSMVIQELNITQCGANELRNYISSAYHVMELSSEIVGRIRRDTEYDKPITPKRRRKSKK